MPESHPTNIIGQLEFRNRRGTGRFKVHYRLPGVLATKVQGSRLPALLIDVSSEGMGIASPHRLDVGSELIYVLGPQPAFALRVVWRCHDRQQGLYRYGLQVTGSSGSIQECLESYLSNTSSPVLL